MITVFSNNEEIPVNYLKFSDGAITFKLDQLPKNAHYIAINVDPRTPVNEVREEICTIAECLFELVRDNYFDKNVPLTLNLPYLPYGRADRVFEQGNPNQLRSFLCFLDMIGGFDEILIKDIHNPECLAWYDNLPIIHKTQLECYLESLPYNFDTTYDYVVAPDKGAMLKANTIAKHLEVEIGYASKKRCIETGKILETLLPDMNFKGKAVLIPDDLCDYGGTFLQLTKLLKEAGASEVHLYVTHLICAGGLSKFKGLIDKVYYHQIISNYINNEDIMRFNNGY